MTDDLDEFLSEQGNAPTDELAGWIEFLRKFLEPQVKLSLELRAGLEGLERFLCGLRAAQNETVTIPFEELEAAQQRFDESGKTYFEWIEDYLNRRHD